MNENKNNVELFTKTLSEIFQLNLNNKNERESDKFNPLDLPLSIPDYQRIYCWTEKNVYQLLDDIIINVDKLYHLGNIILHKTKNDQENFVYAIVDGQQRLVTLALLLFHLNPDIELTLIDERFESSEAQSYIGYNKTLIGNFVTKNKEKLAIDKILKRLQFSVLIINDGSLDLAYTFFSNQNSRGKSLSDYDLLKAHHLRFITIEKQAIHLAERWDNIILNSDNDASDKDLGRTFGIYLFRLRKWMRKTKWSDDEKFKVKIEFEAALNIPDIPPFGEQFHFYESIQGGTHFFAYADHYIYKYKTFSQTSEFKTLDALKYESHWWYKDVIETMLFAYYLKFGTIYLSEALFCIERIVSEHRYSLGRSSLRSVLEYVSNSEITMMIDQATSPTFFLAETLHQIKKLSSPNISGIRGRYNNRVKGIYAEISKTMCIESIKQLI
jgi:hypothetical protein